MRPPEDKDLIQAIRIVDGKKEKTTIDIRVSRWQKINNKWVSDESWTPANKDSVNKLDAWIREITRIIPSLSGTEATHKERDLDDQLSAVEGHKKIEIEETKDSWIEPTVEETKEEPRIGEEIEKEPWVDRAKILLGILLGAIIAGFFIYANRPVSQKEEDEKLFIKEEFIKLEKGNWSPGKKFPGIGTIHLYNTSWDKIGDKEDLVKRIALQIIVEFEDGKLEELNLSEKEQLRRIKEILDSKRPLLILIPENSPRTTLWVSRAGGIIKERKDRLGDPTWEFLRSKTQTNIEFLQNN
jgi:hypothetical protein